MFGMTIAETIVMAVVMVVCAAGTWLEIWSTKRSEERSAKQ